MSSPFEHDGWGHYHDRALLLHEENVPQGNDDDDDDDLEQRQGC